MELNGAFSNPFVSNKSLLKRLSDLHRRLLQSAAACLQQPRSAPPKVNPVLKTITLVLQEAQQPMRACEIHVAAERLAGQPLRWSSVKAALAANTSGSEPRFRRIQRGHYEIRIS
jgi:hypothetical protein